MKSFFLLFIFILLNSCLQKNSVYTFTKQKPSGYYKVGSSYTVKGVTYKPQHYENYEEIGIASWYGGGFHNKLTANGDIFNRHLITAAHKTLPLPSFVEVANLENGKKLIIKVNDRGPFIDNRIIDLSEQAAKILGFHKKGTAKVHIKYLKNMTHEFLINFPSYRNYYEKAVQNYRKDSFTNYMNKGYISKFTNPNHAKTIASKLRNQGFKNVRLTFNDGKYYIHMS